MRQQAADGHLAKGGAGELLEIAPEGASRSTRPLPEREHRGHRRHDLGQRGDVEHRVDGHRLDRRTSARDPSPAVEHRTVLSDHHDRSRTSPTATASRAAASIASATAARARPRGGALGNGRGAGRHQYQDREHGAPPLHGLHDIRDGLTSENPRRHATIRSSCNASSSPEARVRRQERRARAGQSRLPGSLSRASGIGKRPQGFESIDRVPGTCCSRTGSSPARRAAPPS